MRAFSIGLCLTLAACGDASQLGEDGPVAPAIDQAALPDLQVTADLALSPDLAMHLLGMESGPCGVLKPLLHDPNPSLVENEIVFMPPEMYARSELSPDGQRLYDTPNAGGSSTESEIMGFELLRFCDGAVLLKTETEIAYAPPDDMGANTITDILVGIDGDKVGVSVTRAYKPSGQGPMTDPEVRALLEKKLAGVNRSSMRVLPADKWVKQILYVWAADMAVVAGIERVWPLIDPAIKADTIVLMTASTGGGFIYCNPDPPLGMECPP